MSEAWDRDNLYAVHDFPRCVRGDQRDTVPSLSQCFTFSVENADIERLVNRCQVNNVLQGPSSENSSKAIYQRLSLAIGFVSSNRS